MTIGVQETSPQRAMFISGQMAFISTSGAMMPSMVIIGVTSRGDKEFLAIEDGYRESEQS